jgi:hypothetical protein
MKKIVDPFFLNQMDGLNRKQFHDTVPLSTGGNIAPKSVYSLECVEC